MKCYMGDAMKHLWCLRWTIGLCFITFVSSVAVVMWLIKINPNEYEIVRKDSLRQLASSAQQLQQSNCTCQQVEGGVDSKDVYLQYRYTPPRSVADASSNSHRDSASCFRSRGLPFPW